MGILGRADCHSGEAKVRQAMGGDGGGDRAVTPFRVGLVYQADCYNKGNTNSEQP